MRIDNNHTIKRNKSAKLKSVFIILENNYFQSHENISYLLISEYRPIYSSMKSQ